MSREPIPGMPGYDADRVMRSMCYDSALIQPGVTEYKIFDDSDDLASESSRANSVSESNLIKWLLSGTCEPDMDLTREELGIPANYKFHAEIRQPIIQDKEIPGDIDLLAIDEQQPQLSIAIQVKRVKAFVREDGKADIYTKLIPKAVKQAREMMQKYRFHRNYLMLILVADTQYHKHDLQLFRNISLEEKLCMYEHPELSNLPPEVGLYFYEINQPSKNPIGQTAVIAVKQHRPAKLFEQLSLTTERIIEYLKAH